MLATAEKPLIYDVNQLSSTKMSKKLKKLQQFTVIMLYFLESTTSVAYLIGYNKYMTTINVISP